MSQFKKGQTVYCLAFGNGVVYTIDKDSTYPVVFDFPSGETFRYTMDGKLSVNGPVCLYHTRPEIIVPKWQPEPGQWCWFWDISVHIPSLRRFKEMINTRYRDMDNVSWILCEPFVGELPSCLKEVEI